MTNPAKPMKPFHHLSSQFVIRVKIGGIETHMQFSGIGRQEFEKRAGSLQSGGIRAKGGEVIEVRDATKFNWQAVTREFEVLLKHPDLFPAFEEMEIVRVS